jgi:cytochrome P450
MMVAESNRAAEAWQPGSTIDMAAEMKRLTLTIVGASLFGSDFRDSAGRIADVLQRVLNRGRLIAPVLALLEPLAKAYRRSFPHGRSLFFPAERAELESILAPVIGRVRHSQSGNILSHLLADLSDSDATNEIVTMVLAGHETTATALAWAWHLIAKHPEAETRLLEDGADHAFAGMAFKEAMRLYPPAPAFGRRPKENVEIGGYEIPAGASIILSPFITQRNERWFARPASFEPERWQGISVPKFAYFPFGGGAKMCIGESFARMEGTLVLATLIRRWKFIPQGPDPGMRAVVTLRPDRPLWMRAELRRV